MREPNKPLTVQGESLGNVNINTDDSGYTSHKCLLLLLLENRCLKVSRVAEIWCLHLEP